MTLMELVLAVSGKMDDPQAQRFVDGVLESFPVTESHAYRAQRRVLESCFFRNQGVLWRTFGFANV